MSIRALIVDDSSVMRKIVERSLRQAGIDLSEVFQAGNGAEALGVLKESKVDLILCDIRTKIVGSTVYRPFGEIGLVSGRDGRSHVTGRARDCRMTAQAFSLSKFFQHGLLHTFTGAEN